MMLMLQLRIMVKATLLLSLLIVHSNARVVITESGKPPSLTHNEDKAMFHNFDYPNMVENDEENEVIAVRLLNSHHSKPLLPDSVDVQNVSYENVQDVRTDETIIEHETEEIQRDEIETTTSRNLVESKTLQILNSYEDSLEEDWVRSQIEIPHSSEEKETPASSTTSTTPKPTSTTVKTLLRATTLPPSSFRSPVVFGYRRRKARNHHYYDELPEIDFDQLDLDDLEESEINGKRQKEFIFHGFESESTEQPVRHRKRRPKKRPSPTTECPCFSKSQTEQPAASVIEHDYDTRSVEHQQLAPLKKRFTNQQQNHLPTDDFLNQDLSLERAERVQGALERIMGFVTIMSHVDSFVHKKTKQSIRRLAKLYESYEEE